MTRPAPPAIQTLALLLLASSFAAAQAPPTPAPATSGQMPGQPGQPPRPPQPPGKISGRVLRAENARPLTKATVTLQPEGRFTDSQTTRVDANGKFEFPEVAPGRYRLTAERNGFVRQTYGQRGGGPGVVLDVQSRQVVDNIQFSLERGGVVSGVIVDEDNEPVEGVEVRAQRLRFEPGGQQRPNTIRAARTDDLGAYRVTGLPPGLYFVQAGGRGDGVSVSPIGGGFSYASQYYPGMAGRDQAQRVQVTAGGESRRIDFSLRAGTTYVITGVIVDPNPPSGPINYFVGSMSGRSMASFGLPGDDNKFTLRNLEPGDHQIFAQVVTTSGEQRRGYRKVTITDSDVQVVIEIGKTATLSGEVKLVGEGAPVNLARAFVGLRSDGDPMPFGGSPIKDGRFEIKAVPEGGYTLTFAETSNTAYLKEGRCAGEDRLIHKMNLVADQVVDDCVLLIGHDVATAAVTVTRDGQPAEGAYVVFIPKEEEKRKLPRAYPGAQTDATGMANVRGIVPGDYYAYALPPSDDLIYYDVEFYSRNRDTATTVTIPPNGQQALALKVITPK